MRSPMTLMMIPVEIAAITRIAGVMLIHPWSQAYLKKKSTPSTKTIPPTQPVQFWPMSASMLRLRSGEAGAGACGGAEGVDPSGCNGSGGGVGAGAAGML
jgi:hypothetical protein